MKNKKFLQHERALKSVNGTAPSGPRIVYYNALIRRLNYRLKDRGEVIRKTRNGNRYQAVLGKHYLVDLETDKVLKAGVILRKYAKKYGVLRAGEALPN